jgi:hypothetical protein
VPLSSKTLQLTAPKLQAATTWAPRSSRPMRVPAVRRRGPVPARGYRYDPRDEALTRATGTTTDRTRAKTNLKIVLDSLELGPPSHVLEVAVVPSLLLAEVRQTGGY